MYYHIVSVFKNGPSKFCGRQSLKNSKWYDRPKQTISYHFKFFKGCLPQILLVSFLDTVTHMWVIIAIAAIIESNNNNILQEKQSNQRTYFTENTWKWGLSLIRKLSYLHIYVFFMLSLFVMLIEQKKRENFVGWSANHCWTCTVCIGVSTPPQQHHPPLSGQASLLNLQLSHPLPHPDYFT